MSSAHKSPIRNHHQRRNYRHHHGSNPAPPIPSINIISSSLNTSPGTTGTANPSKKKFGKNLNKLVKQQQQQQPSAPPPIQGSSRGGGASSSGLLLLSTKGTKKSVTGSTNTHEALVSVLNGGEGGGRVMSKVSIGTNSSSDRDGTRGSGGHGHTVTGKKETVGVVWGKASASASASTPATSLTTFSRDKNQPNGSNATKTKSRVEEEVHPQQKSELNGILNRDSKNAEKNGDVNVKDQQNSLDAGHPQKRLNLQPLQKAKINSSPIPSVIPVSVEIPILKSSTPSTTKQPFKNGEDQVEFMKKLAKERAEKRRKEEEARIQEQKERAAARLKELELKMNLGKKNSKGANAIQSVNATNVAKKKLYDPTRSYSSLLGGGNGVSSENADNINATSPKISSSVSPKIQFSSYEDRDRGGRGSNAGPRMLFDPKSGSMVAAPSRDVGATSSRGRKEKKKSRSGKDREIQVSNLHDDTHENGDARPTRYRNKREGGFRKNKHKDSNEEKVNSEGSTVKTRRNNVRRGRTLPRTCGVLYKKDSAGHIVSADGCEGDQGYGAHSVPGGRVRNAKGFAAFRQRAKLEEKQQRSTSELMYGNHAYAGVHTHQQYIGFSSANGDYDYVNEWQNYGLNRSHFMRKNQEPKHDDQQYSTKNQDIELSFNMIVKGDEKLDLFTGLEDSPKLQATAAAWAPSEAVLALATASGKREENDAVNSESESDSDLEISESGVYAQNAMALVDNESAGDVDEIEASPSIGLGLGFDPAKDMDTMMMSPTIDFESSEKESNLPGLNLDRVEDSSSIPLSTTNPFVTTSGLLGSSTWGAGNSNSMGSLSNWDYLGGGGGGANGNTNNAKRQNEESSSSFLSLGNALGSQTTWGSSSGFAGGFSGINSPSMGNSD